MALGVTRRFALTTPVSFDGLEQEQGERWPQVQQQHQQPMGHEQQAVVGSGYWFPQGGESDERQPWSLAESHSVDSSGMKRTHKEAFDPLHKKERQRAKNRKTAEEFRKKMDGLRSYLMDRVEHLNDYVKTLMAVVIAIGQRPPDPYEATVDGEPVRRSRTSHI